MTGNKKILKKGTLPITVTKEVVSHLSIGLYRNFARAVKELISNAYDAGATNVKIKLDLENPPTKIIIRDNGRGMNKSDVQKKFLKIGVPTRLAEKKDELGRKRIGTFGIGCISVFPYCRTVRVISKKRKENKIVEVIIDADRFFKEGTFDLGRDAKSMVPYQEYESDLPEEEGETIIILESLKPHIVEELKQKEFSGKSSVEKFGGYHKFIWSLSQYIPIEFPSSQPELRDFFKIDERVPLRVWVNGIELHRNVPENVKILEKGEKKFNGIHLKYAIMSPYEPVRPKEARGLQVRLRDVAIGSPTDFNIVSLTGKVPGKLNWICGEIHILKGLSSALMIDRDSFSFTKEVALIHDFFRKRLSFWNDKLERWASEDKEIYESISNLKNSEKIINALKKSGVLRISKERLKIRKSVIVRTKKEEILSTKEALERTLSKSGYRVIPKRGAIQREKPPIEIDSRVKSILIHEDHPDLKDTIKIKQAEFKVEYDEWAESKDPYPICKLSKESKTVTFNRAHPLFKSTLDDEVVKKLSLGILLIMDGRKDQEIIIRKLNDLLKEVFLG
ncbi:MAG: ATP-binding protein [Candidatus Helarchaeota archaeon]